MLEAQALHDIMQLDIDAEIVGIQLQLIARPQAAVFADVHRQRGGGAVDAEVPMLVLAGPGVEITRRSEERRVGEGRVSTGSSRCTTYHSKTHIEGKIRLLHI